MSTFFSKSLWRLLLTVLPLSAARPLFAQTPTWQDATSPGAGVGNRIAVDVAGNTYVTGSFTGTATFGATTLTSAGGEDVFVAKRTPAGIWQWATSVGGNRDDIAYGVAVDGSGSVVITGSFDSPTITFGVTTLTNVPPGYVDMFVAKLTPTGAWQWVNGAGGNGDDIGIGLALDGNGGVVVLGSFDSSTLTFGAATLSGSAPRADVFVAKLTPTGTWQWATSAGGRGIELGYSVALDGSGSVIITGEFGNLPATFGATTLTSAGRSDAFVAKLTPTGTWQWAISVGGSEDDAAVGVALDGSGSAVVTGYFGNSPITFGATTFTSAGGKDFFVAKLTPAGAWQWATRAGASGDDVGFDVAVDGSGSAIVTGYFDSPTIPFGATALSSAGGKDVFVAKLTPAGSWQWATSAGGSGDDVPIGITLDGSGNATVSGRFDSPTISFGPTTLSNPNPGSAAIFLARLSTTNGLPEDPTQPAFTLAPNPARTTVQLTGATGPTATLLDGLGRVVGTAAITQGAATLDVRALPAGLYLLRAGAATRRLVVE